MARIGPVQRALGVPELLASIMKVVPEKSTLFAAALTSKTFMEPALDELWREVDDLCRIFELLSPLEGPDEGQDGADFLDFGTPLDWSRFYFYSSRIRKLTQIGSSQDGIENFPSLHTLERVTDDNPYPDAPLFPKLTSLTWAAYSSHLRFIQIFVQPGLKHLSLAFWIHDSYAIADLTNANWPKSVSEDLAPAFQVLLTCEGLALETLHLYGNFAISVVDLIEHLIQKSAASLRSIILPYDIFNNDIFQKFSQMPRLEELRSSKEWMRLRLQEEASLEWPHPVGLTAVGDDDHKPFPHLKSLAVLSRPNDIGTWIQESRTGEHLISLTVTSVLPLDPSSLKHALTLVASTQLNLETLVIDGHQDWVSSETVQALPFEYDCIAPVLGFKKLTEFRLHLNYPLSIEDENLYTLASGWPKLKILYLNHSPPLLRMGECHVSVDSISFFAALCDHIEELGLFINPYLPSRVWPQLDGRHKFLGPSFRRLDFGTSPVTQPLLKRVAIHLSTILPTRSRTHPFLVELSVVVTGGPYGWSAEDRETDVPLLTNTGEDQSTLWHRLQDLCELVFVSRKAQEQIEAARLDDLRRQLEEARQTVARLELECGMFEVKET